MIGVELPDDVIDGSHRLHLIAEGDAGRLPAHVFHRLATDLRDRQRLQGFRPAHFLDALGWESNDRGAAVYLVGSLALWHGLASNGLPIPVLDHLAASCGRAGVPLARMTLESRPIRMYAPMTPGGASLPFEVVSRAPEVRRVFLHGALSETQTHGIATHLDAVCRQYEWMAGRCPADELTTRTIDRTLHLPVALRSAVVCEGIGLASELWWARIERIELDDRDG